MQVRFDVLPEVPGEPARVGVVTAHHPEGLDVGWPEQLAEGEIDVDVVHHLREGTDRREIRVDRLDRLRFVIHHQDAIRPIDRRGHGPRDRNRRHP